MLWRHGVFFEFQAGVFVLSLRSKGIPDAVTLGNSKKTNSNDVRKRFSVAQQMKSMIECVLYHIPLSTT